VSGWQTIAFSKLIILLFIISSKGYFKVYALSAGTSLMVRIGEPGTEKHEMKIKFNR
jgi:hypothetical protein